MSPKVLSTSLAFMAFELENGVQFQPFERQGSIVNIHDVYPVKTFSKSPVKTATIRVAFIRDPVERIQSLYRNRILKRHKKEAWQFRRAELLGLDPNPTLSTFVKKLNQYANVMPTIEHHVKDQVAFLGTDPNYYHHIFHPRQVEQFEGLISELLGQDFKLPHEQRTGGEDLPLTFLDRTRLKRRYRADYKCYGRFMV